MESVSFEDGCLGLLMKSEPAGGHVLFQVCVEKNGRQLPHAATVQFQVVST